MKSLRHLWCRSARIRLVGSSQGTGTPNHPSLGRNILSLYFCLSVAEHWLGSSAALHPAFQTMLQMDPDSQHPPWPGLWFHFPVLNFTSPSQALPTLTKTSAWGLEVSHTVPHTCNLHWYFSPRMPFAIAASLRYAVFVLKVSMSWITSLPSLQDQNQLLELVLLSLTIGSGF